MKDYINTWKISKESVLSGENHFLAEVKDWTPYVTEIPPIHNHIFTEIEFIAEGKCDQEINGHFIECQTGSLFLMFPHDVHQFVQFREKTRIYSLCFADDVLPRELLDLLFKKSASLYTQLTGNALSNIQNCFEKLLQENKNSRLCRNLLIKNYISEIVVEILRQADDLSFSISNPTLRSALTYIRENFKESLSLEQLAQKSHLTPQYFCKLFKNNLNISFHEYVRNIRLDYAMMLLSTTEMNVTEVCIESGFNSLSNFTKNFKERFQISPKEVRYAKPKSDK